MSRQVLPWAKEHPVVLYFTLAYAISWVIVSPLVASAQGFIDVPVPFALHYLNDYAPLLAAVITTRITDEAEGLRGLFRRMIKWRVGLGWVLVAAFSMPAVFGLAALIVRAEGGASPELGLLGNVSYVPYLGLGAWAFWILTAGIGEETGWRGYALPKLQRNMSALSATLIIAVLWVGWHLPRFFYFGAFMQRGFSVLPLFALQELTLAILLTWLYIGTRGSILMAALLHGGFNTFPASPAAAGDINTIAIEVLVIWAAVLIVVALRPTDLSCKEGAAGLVLGGVTTLALGIDAAVDPEEVASPGFVVFGILGILLMLIGLAKLHALQKESYGYLGRAGYHMIFVASAVQILGAADQILGAAASLSASAAFGWFVFLAGSLGLLVGFVLFGVATLQAAVLPRWYGVALVVAVPVGFALVQYGGTQYGSILLGLVFIVLGYVLWSRRNAPVEQP
jgi:membrane protease YdiL (CAAX protease family)